jgi:hypothetical protein
LIKVKFYQEEPVVTSIFKKASTLKRGHLFRLEGDELEVKETRASDNGTALCIYAYDLNNDDLVVRKDVDLDADIELVGQAKVRLATNIVARTH